MQVFDTDSHLRDNWRLDEVYKLEGEFAAFTPRRVSEGTYIVDTKFEHQLSPWTASEERAFYHEEVYNPDTSFFGDREIGERQMGGVDMNRRLADADREGIDKQVVFPTQIAIPSLKEGPLGAALARSYNNWARELIRGHEDRLFPVAIPPAGHPEAMAAELERTVKVHGFKAAHLACWTKTRTMDDPAFYPFYEMAEKLDVPLFCHPNSRGPSQSRFGNFFAIHVLGRPFNCAMGLIGLVTGGIFEMFPKLRVTFFECSAEWILYWMHRLDDDYEFMQHGYAPKLKMKPSEYIKRNVYVTCEVDEMHLDRVFEEFPETHVLMASDYPHYDSEFPDTIRSLRARTDLTDRQKELILSVNPAELLRV
jgi:predicted TIM-barrel fold metal-dependent hydrolase